MSVTLRDHNGNALTVPDGPVSVRRTHDTRLHRPFGIDAARRGIPVQALCFCTGTRAHEIVAAEPDCPDCLGDRAMDGEQG